MKSALPTNSIRHERRARRYEPVQHNAGEERSEDALQSDPGGCFGCEEDHCKDIDKLRDRILVAFEKPSGHPRIDVDDRQAVDNQPSKQPGYRKNAQMALARDADRSGKHKQRA